MHPTSHLTHAAILLLAASVVLTAQERQDKDPDQNVRNPKQVTPVEIGVGGDVRRENPYQSEAEALRPAHVHLRWASRYVTEGRDNLDGDPLTSLSSEVAFGNLTFTPWLAYSSDTDYTELDLNLVYGRRLTDQLDLYAGYNHIQAHLPGDNAHDNKVSLDLIYTPTSLFDLLASAYHSFDADGAFWKLALRREQILNDKTILTFRSILGGNEGYVPQGHDGLNHAQLRLNLAYYPAPRIELTSFAAYNIAIDSDPQRHPEDENLHDFFFAGLGIVYHF